MTSTFHQFNMGDQIEEVGVEGMQHGWSRTEMHTRFWC